MMHLTVEACLPPREQQGFSARIFLSVIRIMYIM